MIKNRTKSRKIKWKKDLNSSDVPLFIYYKKLFFIYSITGDMVQYFMDLRRPALYKLQIHFPRHKQILLLSWIVFCALQFFLYTNRFKSPKKSSIGRASGTFAGLSSFSTNSILFFSKIVNDQIRIVNTSLIRPKDVFFMSFDKWNQTRLDTFV